MLDINAHDDQGRTGMEPAIQSSAERLKQNAQTTGLWRQLSNSNNGKYVERQSNSVITDQKICKDSSIDCTSAAQVP